MSDIPKDIHEIRPWLSVIRHIRGKAKSGGAAVVTLQILVDENAQPILWLDAEVTRVFPMRARGILKAMLDK